MTAAAAEEEKLPILYNQPSTLPITTYRSNQPRSPPQPSTTTTQPSMDDNIQYSDLQLHEEEEEVGSSKLSADEKSVSSLSSAAGEHQQKEQQEEEDTADSATSLRDSSTNYCVNRAAIIITMMTSCNNNPIVNRLLNQTNRPSGSYYTHNTCGDRCFSTAN